MAVSITDSNGNKPKFTQWESDRILRISGTTDMPICRFANPVLTQALVVNGEADGPDWTCEVPNILLQVAGWIFLSVVTQNSDGEVIEISVSKYPVLPRMKPQDYEYTDNIGYVNWVQMSQQAQDLVDSIQTMLDNGDLKGDIGHSIYSSDSAWIELYEITPGGDNGYYVLKEDFPEADVGDFVLAQISDSIYAIFKIETEDSTSLKGTSLIRVTGARGPAGPNGDSPTIAVSDITGGHLLTITDINGTRTVTVLDGEDGADGATGSTGPRGYGIYQATGPIEDIGADGYRTSVTYGSVRVGDFVIGNLGDDVVLMPVTYVSGTTAVGDTVIQVSGPQGQDGDDGYSPTVTVTDITGGHRVTITDLNGNHTFDVMDGQDGGGSSPGIYGGSNVPLVFMTSDLSGWVEANISNIGATPAVGDYVIGSYSSNIYMFKVAAILSSSVSGSGAIKLTGPTKTSDLTNDSGFVSNSAGNAYRAASIPMGALDSSSTATVMTATIPGITELRDGVCVWLYNGDITSASGVTLNINGLGAKPIYNSLSGAVVTTAFAAASTYLFVYNSTRVDGGCWDMCYGYDANTTYTPVKLGFGYGTCTTAAATAAKTAAISSYTLTSGGIVAIKFSNDVPANATLNINSKGAKAIYYQGAPITAGVIKAGDTVTMIYSTYYHVLSIDRDEAPVTSVNGQTGAVALTIPSSASEVGAIPAPSSPTSGQFLVYNGTAWVAQTLATWQASSY